MYITFVQLHLLVLHCTLSHLNIWTLWILSGRPPWLTTLAYQANYQPAHRKMMERELRSIGIILRYRISEIIKAKPNRLSYIAEEWWSFIFFIFWKLALERISDPMVGSLYWNRLPNPFKCWSRMYRIYWYAICITVTSYPCKHAVTCINWTRTGPVASRRFWSR